jgi:hypothetical protein
MDDCAKKLTLLICLAILQLCSVVQSLSAQEPQFPYQGLVVTRDASIYSGPGKMHYVTDVLEPGDVVTVYRHDLDGWCAIRPPQGSFSLIPEAAVEHTRAGFAEITEDEIQAWVGTAKGAVEKPLWQVKMKLGEEVQLLGEVSWPDPEGHSTIWYQIAPPNGEFRWVHINDIQLPQADLPEEFDFVSGQQSSEMAGQFQSYEERNQGWRPAKIPFEEQNEIRLASATQLVPQKPGKQNIRQASSFDVINETPNQNGFVTPSADPRRFEQATGANYVGPLPGERSMTPRRENRPERFASADTAFGSNPASQTLTPVGPAGGVKLTSRLQAIDLRLSREVTKPEMQNWQLAEVAMEAQAVLNQPADQSEAIAAQRLLDKVNNFRQIQRNASSASIQLQNSSPFSLGSGREPAESPSSTVYDAQGWLNELVLKRGTVDSTYVLEDDQGRITHHVQAAPGLNLHRYLRSKIGIVGQRGYHQQLNLNHILVERLIVLEKPRR